METITQVKERPILFSTPMVQAILEGRKTQTRRVVKQQPSGQATHFNHNPTSWPEKPWNARFEYEHSPDRYEITDSYKCPYGQVGDRLWVRETWSGVKQLGGRWVREKFHYKASESDNELIKWKPSIHMPRVACRLELEITGIRVERLQDIGGADALEEGIETVPSDQPVSYKNYLPGYEWDGFAMPKDSFETLWQSINGAESWNANPWVWVVEFSKV